MSFTIDQAKRINRRYNDERHELWRDKDGQLMLGCTSPNHDGVAINWPSFQRFKEEGGQFVGLRSRVLNLVVSIGQLPDKQPRPGDEFIVITPGDVGVEPDDDTPCGYGNTDIPF